MGHKTFLLFILIFPGFLFSQQPLQADARYLNVEIERTPVISGAYFLQDSLALEMGVGAAFNGEQESNGLGVHLGVDKYLHGGRLVPFVGGYTRFEINPNALNKAFWEGSRLSLGGHWGLNLFVLSNLSVAGTLGGEVRLNSPKDEDSSTTFTTFTSGIQVRFFF